MCGNSSVAKAIMKSTSTPKNPEQMAEASISEPPQGHPSKEQDPPAPSGNPVVKPDVPDASKQEPTWLRHKPDALDALKSEPPATFDDYRRLRMEAAEEFLASQKRPLFFIDEKTVKANASGIARYSSIALAMRYWEDARIVVQYDEREGLWKPLSKDEAEAQIATLLDELIELKQVPDMERKVSPSLIKEIMYFFKLTCRLGKCALKAMQLPVANGVLDLSGETPQLRAYRQEDYCTWKMGVPYDPNAKADRFLRELVRPALELPEDESLLQCMWGSMLQQGNKAQRIFLIDGEGGSGKTTFVSIFEFMLGMTLIGHLRTSLLGGRFETSFLEGKWIIIGKDVDSDALMHKSASMIKSLTGDDMTQVEVKYAGKKDLRGNFHVLLVSNKRLRIRIDGDAGAWRRRIIRVPFTRTVPHNDEKNLAGHLIEEEGAGLLNWAIVGLYAHRAAGDDYKLTDAQKQRNDDLIQESEGVTSFLRLMVEKGVGTISSEELWLSYEAFTMKRGWTPLTKTKFQSEAAAKMEEIFGSRNAHDIMRDGKHVHGYRRVRLIESETTTNPSQHEA